MKPVVYVSKEVETVISDMQPSFPNNFLGFIWKSTCMLQWATILLCKPLSGLGLMFLLSLVAVDDFLLHYVVKFSCLSIF